MRRVGRPARARRCRGRLWALLVSCCLQKIQAPERAALSRTANEFRPRRPISDSRTRRYAAKASKPRPRKLARAKRGLAVRRLLRARGVDVRPGEEMRGVNRRRAHAGFRELASRVLASRALPPATDAELTSHEENARSEHLSIRRSLIATPPAVTTRRACGGLRSRRATEERGSAVQVVQLFEDAITPRNTLLLAEPRRETLRS